MTQGSTAIAFRLNGSDVETVVRNDQTLLELLRGSFGLTGARESCGQGVCGACTVEVDGMPVSSCLYWAVQLDGTDVATVESLARDGTLDPLQQAFVESGAFQCGFCTPGMIMMCRSLLRENPDPSDEEIRRWLSGSICRCGAYPEILAAVHAAAATLREQAAPAGRATPDPSHLGAQS
jgi:carbon-monoxide dehydrogenase small subunit